MKVKVIKIGGAVTANHSALKNIKSIIDNESNVILIISAFGKTTRNLAECALNSERGSFRDAIEQLNNIFNFHFHLIDNIFDDIIDIKSNVFELYAELKKIIESINVTSELTPATLDKVMAYGEKLAIEIISKYLKSNNINNRILNAEELIITDSNFNKAKPDIEQSLKNINNKLIPELNNYNLILTQGFVGADKLGKTTTMGIESSNMTTKLIAEAVGSKNIIIYSDVEGIRSIDPKIMMKTKALKSLSYDQAIFASNIGLKLVYRQLIDFAKKNHVRIEYRSLLNPDGEKTLISDEITPGMPLLNIIDDNYYTEIDINSNSEIYDNIDKIMKLGKGFINDLNIGNGKMKISTWERINIKGNDIKFDQRSFAYIIFIDPDKISKMAIEIDTSKLVSIELDNAHSLIKLSGKKDDIHEAAKKMHGIIYGKSIS